MNFGRSYAKSNILRGVFRAYLYKKQRRKWTMDAQVEEVESLTLQDILQMYNENRFRKIRLICLLEEGGICEYEFTQKHQDQTAG